MNTNKKLRNLLNYGPGAKNKCPRLLCSQGGVEEKGGHGKVQREGDRLENWPGQNIIQAG
jgi:hypothetical protein